MINNPKARFKACSIIAGVLVAFLLTVQLGCGGSGRKIEPPKNPTPLPDPESRIQVGGSSSSMPARNDRKLGR
jgi:hypothetical protein